MPSEKRSIPGIWKITSLLLFIFFLITIPVTIIQAQPPVAPDFILPDLSGNMVSLKDFRGKVLFLDFWATWCVPCRKSIPELVKLDKKYRDKGLVILGLSVDDPDSFDNKYIMEFKERYRIDYRILRAGKETVDVYLGTEDPSVPTLFIIDRDGNIVNKQVGFEPGVAEEALKKLLEIK